MNINGNCPSANEKGLWQKYRWYCFKFLLQGINWKLSKSEDTLKIFFIFYLQSGFQFLQKHFVTGLLPAGLSWWNSSLQMIAQKEFDTWFMKNISKEKLESISCPPNCHSWCFQWIWLKEWIDNELVSSTINIVKYRKCF